MKDKKRVKQLEDELKDMTEIRDRLFSESKDSQHVIERAGYTRSIMYDSLVIERVDLLGRILRIDQRIAGLGLSQEQMESAQRRLGLRLA